MCAYSIKTLLEVTFRIAHDVRKRVFYREEYFAQVVYDPNSAAFSVVGLPVDTAIRKYVIIGYDMDKYQARSYMLLS